MKTKVLLSIFGALLLSSCATEFSIVSTDVPAAVETAFKTKYPSAQSTEWEAEKKDGRLTFEANFKLDGKKKEAAFKPDGTFLSEE